MFKKENRLSAREKLSGPTLNSELFSLKISKNSLSRSRFGFIVSKKIDKRATVRNSLKRKMRSCLEENFKLIKPGYDMLFVIKKKALEKSREEVCQEVTKILSGRKII